MLAATDFTWLLENLKNMTTMPRVNRGSRNGIVWKVEKAVHFFVHVDKVTTNFSTDWGKVSQLMESCLIWDMAQPLYKLHSSFLSAF